MAGFRVRLVILQTSAVPAELGNRMHIRPRPFLCCLLCWQLLAVSMLWAQDSGGLRIAVIAGEGATNYIDTSRAAAPVVQVLDAQGEPVAGAEVVFESPSSGPGMTFFGATHRAAVLTDQEGRAQPTTVLLNTYEGPFTITVSANHDGRTATSTIQQTNAISEPPAKKKFFTWRVIAGIAAALTIVVIAIVRSGDEDPPPAP
jgi:hypothetical protein